MALHSLSRLTQRGAQTTVTSAAMYFVLPEPETISPEDEEDVIRRTRRYPRDYSLTAASPLIQTYPVRQGETASTYRALLEDRTDTEEESFRGVYSVKHPYPVLFTAEVEFYTQDLPRIKPHIPADWNEYNSDDE